MRWEPWNSIEKCTTRIMQIRTAGIALRRRSLIDTATVIPHGIPEPNQATLQKTGLEYPDVPGKHAAPALIVRAERRV